jgi:hypothetical protein
MAYKKRNMFELAMVAVKRMCHPRHTLEDLRSLERLWRHSYLRSAGWFTSYSTQKAVDGNGCPIPWFTYCATEFLKMRLKSDVAVFEYGSGSSTQWWSKRAARVVSCEHDAQWYQIMKGKLSPAVEYHFIELQPGGDYGKFILNYCDAFDVIVIDGRDRVNCAKNCLDALRKNGVVIWDNADREKYSEGYDYLMGKKFRRLDFVGMGPIAAIGWSTAIFYRQSNCLGL